MTSITFDKNNIMIEKECEYCASTYEATRRDSKYCSKTCKNDAYLARKAIPYTATGQSEQAALGVISSHNRRNASAPFAMNNANIQRMLNGANTNQEVLNHLLSEKDLSGDIKSDRSKLEIQLMFVERDLAIAEKKVAEQEALIEKLDIQVEKNKSIGGTIAGIFEANAPAIMMGVTTLLGNLATKNAPAVADKNTPG